MESRPLRPSPPLPSPVCTQVSRLLRDYANGKSVFNHDEAVPQLNGTLTVLHEVHDDADEAEGPCRTELGFVATVIALLNELASTWDGETMFVLTSANVMDRCAQRVQVLTSGNSYQLQPVCLPQYEPVRAEPQTPPQNALSIACPAPAGGCRRQRKVHS